MYKLRNGNGGVIRIADGAFIPNEPQNEDWKAYNHWISLGNIPQPADALIINDFSDFNIISKEVKAMGLVIANLTGKTVSELKQLFKTAYNSLP